MFGVQFGGFYDGEYNDKGQRDGWGRHCDARGNVYEGQWKVDKFDGRGLMKYLDGTAYSGIFKRGKLNGLGVVRWIDGTVCEGIWEDSSPLDVVFRSADGQVLDNVAASKKLLDLASQRAKDAKANAVAAAEEEVSAIHRCQLLDHRARRTCQGIINGRDVTSV